MAVTTIEGRDEHLAAAEGALVRIDDVIAGYFPGVNILNGCDFYAHSGELVCIIGPYGAGKSTLLKSLFGLVKVLSGKVTFDAKDITNKRADKLVPPGMGVVPQNSNAFPSHTLD